MRTFVTALALVATAGALGPGTALGATRKIDLRTKEGAQSVKAAWRYADVKIVEVAGKAPDGKPNTTYNIEPKAFGPDFDDAKWEAVVPETLKDRRSTGQVCFCWYRTKITLPDDVAGKRAFFETTVDDYGEIWVDGQLPRKVGQTGGAVVAGFNAPNRVELKDPAPGKTYQIAIFGMNGPISAAPSNYIFLHNALIEIEDK